jgi:hypothetical protein
MVSVISLRSIPAFVQDNKYKPECAKTGMGEVK